MKLFIGVVVVLFVIDVIGKAIMIYKKDYIRTPEAMIFDMFLLLIFIVWGSYLIGNI